MDFASQEQRLEFCLQEQNTHTTEHTRASHFPSEDGYTLIVLVLLDQLGEAAHLQLGFLGSNSINAPRQ